MELRDKREGMRFDVFPVTATPFERSWLLFLFSFSLPRSFKPRKLFSRHYSQTFTFNNGSRFSGRSGSVVYGWGFPTFDEVDRSIDRGLRVGEGRKEGRKESRRYVFVTLGSSGDVF